MMAKMKMRSEVKVTISTVKELRLWLYVYCSAQKAISNSWRNCFISSKLLFIFVSLHVTTAMWIYGREYCLVLTSNSRRPRIWLAQGKPTSCFQIFFFIPFPFKLCKFCQWRCQVHRDFDYFTLKMSCKIVIASL